jgi:hypothetical protein
MWINIVLQNRIVLLVYTSTVPLANWTVSSLVNMLWFSYAYIHTSYLPYSLPNRSNMHFPLLDMYIFLKELL